MAVIAGFLLLMYFEAPVLLKRKTDALLIEFFERESAILLHKYRMTKRGFTLVELLIVVAIVGMLAAIAIPQFASSRMKAFNSSAVSDSRSFRTAMEAYYSAALFYPASLVGGETIPGSSSPSINIGFSTSTGVSLWYESLGTEYLVNAWNQSGSKQYSYDSQSALMYVAPGLGPLHGTLAGHIAGNHTWIAPWVEL